MSDLAFHPLSRQLLSLMRNKETNLSLSADVFSSRDLIRLADEVGPSICVLKTHIDILDDFSPEVTNELVRLSEKHQFLLFEDRKFADIGHTVVRQYEGGVYRISDWAHITNCHSLPGAGIIEGLRRVGLTKNRGLLLLAEMSSKNHLMTSEYTRRTVEMAMQYPDFVMGFICQRKLSDYPGHIHMMPGVQFCLTGDSLGQQYVTPKQAILERGVDVIIVGRGITEAADPIKTAEKYREAGWSAYMQLK